MHKGKVAIVTGASQGIGAETAKELAAQGASVMLIARNIKNCQKLVSEIKDSGGVASAIKCNIADLSQVQYAVSETVKMSSSLKFCILAAGEADIYAENARAFEWDIAAGHAILEHAGGFVTTHEGKEFLYGKPNYKNLPILAKRSGDLIK